MQRRIEATVTGHVQGVSFRYYTQREARRLGLTGWVANRRDGSVQVIAEGENSALRQLAEFLQQGPPLAHVDDVDITWQPATGEFSQFDINLL